MNCWQCDRPAHGVCVFCGRAVCKEHARTLPDILHMYHSKEGRHKALVVADAISCGLCQLLDDPVDLEHLD
jgi:hypothetical protein